MTLAAALALGAPALAQTEYTLDPSGSWVAGKPPAPGSDEELMARARTLLAEGKASEAKSLMTAWLDEHEETDNPFLADAYLLRGDARTATGSEYWALYDYEEIIKHHAGSDVFERAVEREFDIGHRYLNGLRTRILWMRLEDASPLGEEIMIRVHERIPGSVLAEKALLELADWYYRTRELNLAAESYGIFLRLYPKSQFREMAMQRQVYANIARFKGPGYDATGLIEAQYLIREFADRYPAEAERAGMSDALVARLDESAAAQMLSIARWYLKKSDDVAAQLQLQRLQRKHPQTVAAAQGREIMVAKGWLPGVPAAAPAPAAEPARVVPVEKDEGGTP